VCAFSLFISDYQVRIDELWAGEIRADEPNAFILPDVLQKSILTGRAAT
jgi:hypothetical protein